VANDRQVFHVQISLDRKAALDPATVRAAQDRLRKRLDRHVRTCGYRIMSSTINAQPPAGPSDPVILRLTAQLDPRMDGEWPAIRAALEEDEADRVAAKAARAADPVHGRLDALRAAVAYWGDRELRGLPWPADGPYAR